MVIEKPAEKKKEKACIPKLKKKISAFLTKEDGKISKEKLMKTGAVMMAASLFSLKNAEAGHNDWDRYTHTSSLGGEYDGSVKEVAGTHSHQVTHSEMDAHDSGGWW